MPISPDVPKAVQDTGKGPTGQTSALPLIAGLLIVGAASLLGAILVPFLLALVLAIALAPVVTWIERRGLPTSLGSLACTLFVAAILATTVALLVFQAAEILKETETFTRRTASLIARVSGQLGADPLMRSFGVYGPDSGPAEASDREDPMGSDEEGGHEARWEAVLRSNLGRAGSWLVSGIGGLVGFVGGTVVFLAFLFYMLDSRVDWLERLTRAMLRLGLRPRRQEMGRTQREIRVFVGFVSLVATCYAVLTTLVYWWIGLPNPLLWGLLTGLLEFIPFFGPAIAGTLIATVALTLGTLWQPGVVVAMFVGLNLIEGYVITPLVYGSAVEIDPVTCLIGVLFFGWIWGPFGSVLAMPILILLRGFVVMTPGTPALDALADVEDRKTGNGSQSPDRTPAAAT
jgi:predicted PurR-regulated permease PerM